MFLFNRHSREQCLSPQQLALVYRLRTQCHRRLYPHRLSEKSKDITISAVTSGAAVKYKIITNSTCNATNYGSGGTTVTLSSNSGTVTVTNETDNSKYLCFKVTKTNFSDYYVASAQITGIDDTAPTIITTVGGTNDNRTVSAADNDSSTTNNEVQDSSPARTTCDATEMSPLAPPAYTEGNTLTIAAADNGKKVCFSSTDTAGNTSYQATAALVTGSGLSATVGSVSPLAQQSQKTLPSAQ